MSQSGWEQDALDSIKDGLASSDPTLVARLTIFARLASGEEMPAREKIEARPPHTGRAHQRRGWPQTVPMLLWLVTSVALIAVALVCNRGGSQGTCTTSWATFCNSAASAANSAPGIH